MKTIIDDSIRSGEQLVAQLKALRARLEPLFSLTSGGSGSSAPASSGDREKYRRLYRTLPDSVRQKAIEMTLAKKSLSQIAKALNISVTAVSRIRRGMKPGRRQARQATG